VKNDGGRALRMAYLVASVGGVLFFVLSVVLLAVWPGRVLEQQTRAMAPEHSLVSSRSEQRGRVVYSREGCAYCHTQQVRYLAADATRFGAPTLAWETRFDYPQLWGTRRIGPDLSRIGGTRSEDWHLAHLYAPRTVVSDSVMPAYRALFDGSPDRPRQEARDLVAYLDSLGRARELAGPEAEAAARAKCACPDDEMLQMAFSAPMLNPHPARPRPAGGVPVLATTADLARGQSLYASNCASCHGSHGEGNGPGAVSLRPRPANLAEHEYSLARLAEVLWQGSAGTAMRSANFRPDSTRSPHQFCRFPHPTYTEVCKWGEEKPQERRTGSFFNALLRLDRTRTGSPVSSMLGNVASSSSKNTLPSRRARWTPRQK